MTQAGIDAKMQMEYLKEFNQRAEFAQNLSFLKDIIERDACALADKLGSGPIDWLRAM